MGCGQTNFSKTENGLIIDFPDQKSGGTGKKLALEVVSPKIIKVAFSTTDSALNIPSLVVDDKTAPPVAFSVAEDPDKIELTTDSLLVSVELPSGTVCFYDLENRLLLSAAGNEFVSFEKECTGKQTHIRQDFKWQPDEALYGLGQHRHGHLNLRGVKVDLIQDNTEVSVPFLLSTRGYGLLWDNYSQTVFNDSADSSYIWSDIGDKIQYYFIKGTTFDDIIAQNRKLTGEAPMYPLWALGYMQSRNRYRSEAELTGVVRKQREQKIPLDAIILDYYHWGDQGFGSFVFDEKDFPDPEKMIRDLHQKYHCKLLVSVWPSLTPGIRNWNLFDREGYLLDVMAGFHTQVYDAFNPAAGKLYYELIKEAYLKKGVDGWWFDATEPENQEGFYRSKCHLGTTAKYLNLYSYFDMKNVYERQTAETGKRMFILTRSGFSGQQKFGTTVWSGDIESTFDELKLQIPAGLNFCMSALPYWTTDIGGYKGGNPADPAYQELFTRWFQYGTFCPIFRAHGRRFPGDRSGANEIWSYGREKQKILTDYITFRYRLLPYIYSLSSLVTFEGYTLMRALPFDFAADSRVHNITDQFMFGNDLMVCPVTDAGARERQVYLPKGTRWFDFWTGIQYDGGQEIMAEAPLQIIPLFIRAGSILLMGPEIQYSAEAPADPVELRIFPGSNASFTLYEDETDNFNYLNGQCQRITFRYNDQGKKVTIGEAEGSYPGNIKERTFRIILAGNNGESLQQTVSYLGKEITVQL